MEKTNNIPASPWDILLLPVWVHKKLSIRLEGLIIAVFFVGIFDMFFFQDIFKAGIFAGEMPEIIFKFILFLLFSFIIGVIDLICTMVPIAEFAVMIGKRSDKFVTKNFPVVMMKSYAISHIVFVIPYVIYTYAGVQWENVNVASPPQIRLLFSVLAILMTFMPYIQLGIIYRTISIKTRIQVFGKFILILATYFWMKISGSAIFFIESLLQNILTK